MKRAFKNFLKKCDDKTLLNIKTHIEKIERGSRIEWYIMIIPDYDSDETLEIITYMDYTTELTLMDNHFPFKKNCIYHNYEIKKSIDRMIKQAKR